MNIETNIANLITQGIQVLYNQTVTPSELTVQPTKKEFEGDFTLVTFALTKLLRKKPEEIGEEIGKYLKENNTDIANYNVIKGFLNLKLSESFWLQILAKIAENIDFGKADFHGTKVMVEYSSPNTNKPLHLGHLRNNFLGFSVAEILKAYGYEVMKTNLVNDRGIHICKSMLAYQKFGQGETPQSAGIKGDHLVGKYYVEFDKRFKEQTKPIFDEIIKGNQSTLNDKEKQLVDTLIPKINSINRQIAELEKQPYLAIQISKEIEILLNSWKSKKLKTNALLKEFDKLMDNDNNLKVFFGKLFDLKNLRKMAKLEADLDEIIDEIKGIAQNKTQLLREAQEMLKKWEEGDPATVDLWKKMNSWVYEGFDTTYKTMGVIFDKIYYESNTYLLGKNVVEEGLAKGVFFKKENGSVWVDLKEEGLDEKLVLRADGTSVYITQDLGTSDYKYADFPMEKSIYVVGNEQDYHFKVLFTLSKKLGRSYADGMYHLSYGMVELPSGKMKSREGTVVDADELIAEMMSIAETRTKELGKIDDFSQEEAQNLYRMLALGALKYYLLRVEPKKTMLFNPEDSIDFQGDTGVYIQYTHARICSLLRRAVVEKVDYENANFSNVELHSIEIELIKTLVSYPQRIAAAATNYSPAVIADFAYELARTYGKFFAELSVFNEPDATTKSMRLALSAVTAKAIKSAMSLIGVEVPERM